MNFNQMFDNMKMFSDMQNFMNGSMNFSKNMPDLQNSFKSMKKSTDDINSMNQANMENLQSIGKMQAEIVQKSTERAIHAMNDISASSMNPEQMLAKGQNHMKQFMGNFIESTRELGDMATKSGMEMFDMMAERLNDGISDMFNNTTQPTTASPKRKN